MENNTNTKRRNNPNIMEVPLILDESLSDNLYNEIMEIIQTTKFNKISFPLSIQRSVLDPSVSEDDTRVYTAGYIKKFNRNKFIVFLFNSARDVVKEKFNGGKIRVDFNQYNDHLTVITRLVIVPAEDDEPEDINE